MRTFMIVSKALSDESRVRILSFLRESELCLCQIVEILRLSAATVSKHMSILAVAGLVVVRKEGRWRFYRLPEEPDREASAALAFLEQALAHTRVIEEDRIRVRKVLKMDKEELCRHYKGEPETTAHSRKRTSWMREKA